MLAENVRTGLDIGDCWTWTRYRNHDGYGYARIDGRLVRVHRHVWEAIVGPIPDDQVMDHLCRNRACANPDHLRVTTQSANVTDGLTHSCGHDDWYIWPSGKRAGKRTCHTCKKERQRRYQARKKEADQ